MRVQLVNVLVLIRPATGNGVKHFIVSRIAAGLPSEDSIAHLGLVDVSGSELGKGTPVRESILPARSVIFNRVRR